MADEEKTNKPAPNAPKPAASPRRRRNLQIEVDDEQQNGVYANFTVINHNETEFVLDFVYVQPNQPKAKVRSRVIVSPRHARQFLGALTRNVEMYEKKFGAIPVKKAPPRPPDDSSLVH